MIITHSNTDHTQTTRTTYTQKDNTLTRILRAKIHTVQIKQIHGIADLYRLTALDDETFIILAGLQTMIKGEPQHESN